MSAGPVVRCSIWAGLALALAGCGTTHARSGAALFGARERGEARERVFSVLWWARADESEGIPYRPIEAGAPAVDPQTGTVYVATGDDKVHALATGGRELWQWQGRGAMDAGPTLVDGVLYIATSEGRLVALRAADGHLLWEYASGEEFAGAPAVGESLVVAMSSADTLFAVDRQTGVWRWQYRREPPAQFTIRSASHPLVSGDRVFAGFADGYAVALDARDGSVAWAKQIGTGQQFIDVDAGPVSDGSNVYFAAYSVGVFALEADSGATVWSIKRPGVTVLTIDPDALRLFAGGVGFVAAWSLRDGLPRWRLDLGGERAVTGMSRANGTLLAATGEGPLLFVDEASGRVRRAFNPGRGVSAAPASVLPGETMVLSNRGYVYNLAVEARAP